PSNSPTVLKTWVLALSNVSGDTFNYTLTDVPAGTTWLSAKTDWNLREKLPVTLDINGQASPPVNFTGADQLPGGDIAGPPFAAGSWGPPDNVINLPDYSTLLQYWQETVSGNPAAARADINGDGNINVLDYSILGGNWFTVGDAQ